MFEEALRTRGVPPLFGVADLAAATPQAWQAAREQLRSRLFAEEYGQPLPTPVSVAAEELDCETKFCAGKAPKRTLRLTVTLANGGVFLFPVTAVIPVSDRPVPAFVLLNFRPDVPDRFLPSEELADNGFAVFSFCYTDIVPDADDDFSTGLAAVLPTDRTRPDAAGKLQYWAFAAMRVMDHVVTRTDIDAARVAVIGHSRLGKTALLTGALDPRFACVISNDAGCSGDAVTRGKQGEQLADIARIFPQWFCPAYAGYAGRESALPFDQHDLIALTAPRPVLLCAAAEDLWADPFSQLLGAAAASPAWETEGLPGLMAPQRLPQPGDAFLSGCIGYHLRSGQHYLSRTDWQRAMDFFRLHVRLHGGK